MTIVEPLEVGEEVGVEVGEEVAEAVGVGVEEPEVKA
jgi:pheromone shutdown protein TraB